MQTFLVKALESQELLIKCSLTDHFMSRIAVSFASFYSDNICENLFISALQRTLADFPIFAGVLIKKEHQLYINCNNQGVSLTIVRHSGSLLEELSKLQKLKLSTFVAPINASKAIKKQTPVLTIKLSYYCDGMAIGYCCHHSIADMSTFITFLKALSSNAQEKSYSKPHIVPNRESYLRERLAKFKERIPAISDLQRLNFLNILDFIKYLCKPKKGLYLYFTQDEMETLRSALSHSSGQRLSFNDVLCAHLLKIIAVCRKDKEEFHNASIVTNFRSLLKMPRNTLGNYVGTVSIQHERRATPETIARSIHASIKNHFPNPPTVQDMKSINRLIPPEFLPRFKNLIISNSAYYNTYSIDFGITAPYLLLPLGIHPRPEASNPWVSVMIKGFNDKGVLVALALPSSIIKQLSTHSMLQQLHQYRNCLDSEEEALLGQFPWCK